MFGIAKFPSVIALIIASGVAGEKHYFPVMYGQCQIDEYLKYAIGNTDSYDDIVTSNRTVSDNFDHENFMVRPTGSGAKLYFRSGKKNPFIPMNLSEECTYYGICKEVDDYPKIDIINLVEAYKREHHLENTHFEAQDDAERLSSENEFCFFRTMVFQPQAAQDENNDWYYIVNTEFHSQVIRTNLCRSFEPAALLTVFAPWEKKCVQEHYYRSFKAISWNGEVINKMFKVPSYCSCVIRKK